MDPKPLKIGAPLDPFPGESFNALVAGHLANKATPPNGAGASRGSASRLIVQCNNPTSTTIEPGEILGFSAPIFTLDDPPDGDPNQVYSAPNIKGATPAVPEHSSQFVVALDYIRGTGEVTGGAVGPAVLMGLAWCKVNWTDETHDKVLVAEGETMLQSGTSGLTPVWHEDIPDPEYLPATLWSLVMLGGGGSVNNRTNFAIVIEEADADLGSAGRCILLDNDNDPLDANGDPFAYDVTDPMAGGYDAGDIDDAAVYFYSQHQYAPCPVGVRVWLSATIGIVPGADDDTDHKIKGLMTDPADYYQTFPGAGEGAGLVGGATAAEQHWDSVPCDMLEET